MMTPEEMRQNAEVAQDDIDCIINAIWLAAAEICDRLDKLVEKGEGREDDNPTEPQ